MFIVRSLEPGQRGHCPKRINCTHMCQIKPNENRDVLILQSTTHIHTWDPEGRKGVIFNLDFATTLPFLIWIFFLVITGQVSTGN